MNLEISSVLYVRNPRLEDVSEVVGRLIGFLRDQGVQGQKFLDEFELAATEAINNAIEHGCAASEKKFLNAEMLIKRGNQLVGKVRVTSVEPSTSIADIVANSVPRGLSIQPGDNVIYQATAE